jgi:hypothetical protein
MSRWLASSFSILLFIAQADARAVGNLERRDTEKLKKERASERASQQDITRSVQTAPKAAAQAPGAPEDKNKAAEELWRKVVAAKGGLDALKAIKTRMTISQARVIAPPETLSGGMITTVSYPDKISTEFKIGNNTVYRTLSGDTFWVFATRARQITLAEKALSGKRPDVEALRLKKALEGDPIAFFVLASDPSSELTWLDPLDGKPGLMVKLKNGHAFKAYFNPQTAFLEKLLYTSDYYGEITTLYSDYRSINGIQLPFKMETFRGSAKAEEQLITDFKLNVAIPEDTFSGPRQQ